MAALRQAEDLGCEAIQIFGYRRHEFYFDPKITAQVSKKLDAEILSWRESLKTSPVKQVVVHARQVAILALSDFNRRKLAIEKLRQELELARMLGAHFFVFHLGPYEMGMDLNQGLIAGCEALDHVLRDLPKGSPGVLVENVPGGGRRMGASLEELKVIFGLLKAHWDQLGLCIDLAHLWGAGYDIGNQKGAESFFTSLRNTLDPALVRAFHINNTRTAIASHIDDHWHLAQGVIGADVYRYLMKQWPRAIGILETPKDTVNADEENIEFLLSQRKL